MPCAGSPFLSLSSRTITGRSCHIRKQVVWVRFRRRPPVPWPWKWTAGPNQTGQCKPRESPCPRPTGGSVGPREISARRGRPLLCPWQRRACRCRRARWPSPPPSSVLHRKHAVPAPLLAAHGATDSDPGASGRHYACVRALRTRHLRTGFRHGFAAMATRSRHGNEPFSWQSHALAKNRGAVPCRFSFIQVLGFQRRRRRPKLLVGESRVGLENVFSF